MALRKFLILRMLPAGPRFARPEDRLCSCLEGRTNGDPANHRFPDRLSIPLGHVFGSEPSERVFVTAVAQPVVDLTQAKLLVETACRVPV
jgi:hypothetical protein